MLELSRGEIEQVVPEASLVDDETLAFAYRVVRSGLRDSLELVELICLAMERVEERPASISLMVRHVCCGSFADIE